MSKRGENITKRKDGRWEARYIKGYENGKAVYGYLYGKSYAEAKQKKEDALRSSKELSHSKRTETFNDLLDCFLIQKKYCVKESTYAHYCNLIERHIRAELGMMRLCDLSAYAIERYADEKLSNGKVNSKDGLSPKTVKDLLTLIKSVLKYGITKGLIPSNVISFSSPKVLKKDIEILSKDEQETLEKSTICADNLHFGIYLCLYTGMRIGEVCALQWKDIDLINSTISINKTIPVQIQSDSYVIHNKTTKWSIKHDGEIVKEPCELRHGNYYVIDSDDISFAALVIEYQSLTFSSQAYALNKKTVFIGRSNDMNIVLDLNGNISRKTAAIHTDGNGTHTLEDLSGKTGIYVNGEKTTSCVLSFGDEIFIMGTTMVYFNGMIIIPANVKTTNLDKCTEFDILPPTDAEDVQAYARTPRILKSQETGKVVIDAPTAPQKSKEIPFILTAGPSDDNVVGDACKLGGYSFKRNKWRRNRFSDYKRCYVRKYACRSIVVAELVKKIYQAPRRS